MDILLIIEIALLVLLVVTAIAAIETTNLLTSTIMLCIFSLTMAALYIIMGAPDVAMTEAAVGAGASTLILLAALLLIGEKETAPKAIHKWMGAAIVTPIFLLLCYATFYMPSYGSVDTPAHQHVAKYYIEKTGTEIGIPNIVTAVLASYRGFDTLGETTVILTAGLAVWLLLKKDKA